MKAYIFIFALFFSSMLKAQNSGPSVMEEKLESSTFYNKILQYNLLPLEEEFVHERDVMWEKRIWREIPIQTKTNVHFRDAKQPFSKVLLDLIFKGEINAYSAINDEFTIPLCKENLRDLLKINETVLVLNPETLEEEIIEVENQIDYNRITGYRIKEAWYFDSKYSKLNVRILGIAPIYTQFDEAGNMLFQSPLFWLYYPDLRKQLAKEKIFNEQNNATSLSWTDVFDMRYFESIIVKENNIYDRRIQDYKEGINALLEGQKIHESIRNFESDLWEY